MVAGAVLSMLADATCCTHVLCAVPHCHIADVYVLDHGLAVSRQQQAAAGGGAAGAPRLQQEVRDEAPTAVLVPADVR